MMKRVLILLLLATPALAQLDPLRNVSGTTPNLGASPWVTSGDGGWTLFHGFNAHLTYVSETGPDVQRNETFSTNWITIGAERTFGDRGFLLVRGRASLEPFTTPEEDGYPQMLQYVSPEAGGAIVDRMRPQNLIGEAAVHAGFRLSAGTLLSVYAAYAGDPALGPAPFALRASGSDFAEAPFAYDIQESWHDAASVITGAFATRGFTIEASAFHHSVPAAGDFEKVETGSIDSSSARLTFTPGQNLAIQVSRGKLGEDLAQRDVTSASLSYGSEQSALTALWTRLERDGDPTQTAYGVELTMRGTRNTTMARAEWVDRPAGFPDTVSSATTEQATHFVVGYIFDFMARDRFRAGAGVNIDYHTQSHELPDRYGHKPQSIYAFIRIRSGRL